MAALRVRWSSVGTMFFGKHKRVKFNVSVHITKGTLDYVHADLWGPSHKPSYSGARYMLTIIDDYSRKV